MQQIIGLEIEGNIALERLLEKQGIAVPDIPLTREGFTKGERQQHLERIKFGASASGEPDPRRTFVSSKSTLPVQQRSTAPLMPASHSTP
jgi:hypothetical protein